LKSRDGRFPGVTCLSNFALAHACLDMIAKFTGNVARKKLKLTVNEQLIINLEHGHMQRSAKLWSIKQQIILKGHSFSKDLHLK